MRLVKAKYTNLLHILAIVGVGLILTAPAIFYGVFDAQDLILYHLKWSKYFSEQFWTNDLYPRWLLKMNDGLGSPTFFFYAPIPYYFTSLLHPLFANDPQGWHQLSLSAAVALVASGLTAYIWLKSITNKNSALIASIIYMALPYHLAVDFYWRFAFAEFWSFVWIPLILYFSKKIISGQKLAIVGFAVSYALLIMTHLPTLIMFSLIPISYIIFMAGGQQRKKALISVIVAMTLGVGLSAIYWFPAMTTQKYISMSVINEGMYFYGRNFLHFMHQHEFWIYIGIITLLMGGVAYCAFRIARTHSSFTLRRESNYWMIVALVAIFMMVPLSKPLWSVLPILQRLQFPWRFNTILAVATTALLALGISALPVVNFLHKKSLAVGILLSTSLLISGIIVISVFTKFPFSSRLNTMVAIVPVVALVFIISALKRPVNFKKKQPLIIGILLVTSLLISGGIVIKERLFNVVDVDQALKISIDASEYRPKWVLPNLFQPKTISELGRSSTQVEETLFQGSRSIQQWKPRKIVLEARATTDSWLTIHQFYYPGWTARLKGESHLLPVQPSESEGLLRIKVPSGTHEIIVTLDTGVEERAGQIISAVSATVIVFLMFWFLKIAQVEEEFRIQNSEF